MDPGISFPSCAPSWRLAPHITILKIIVVDDNSPDGTYQQVCETFADDPRMSAILRTHDRGLAKSIRAGIDRSTADYIVVMDTDFTHDPKEISNSASRFANLRHRKRLSLLRQRPYERFATLHGQPIL
jgi:glycosyltransferase involved in cell wall biosynthesis